MKQSITKAAEWPAYRILLAVSAPAAAITLAEIIFRELYDHWLMATSIGGNHLYFTTPIIFMVLGGACFGLVLSSPAARVTLTIAAIVVGIFVVVQFRGSHRWMGFYDLVDDSRIMFYFGWLIAVCLGVVSARILSVRSLELICFSVLALAVAFTWMHALSGLNIMTFIPYTRHFGISVLALVVGLGALYDRFFGSAEWRMA